MDTIDITAHLGAVTREVRDAERDGKPARCLVVRRVYDTDIDDLWNAVTDKDRIPRWFLPITGDLVVGGTYQTEGNAGGTVLACDAPQHFAVTWEFGGDVSWVDVFLTTAPDGSGTELRLEHTAVVGPHWTEYGPGAVGIGWEYGLLGLAIHLRTRTTVDPGEFMAWQMSPEAFDVTRQVGTLWGDADAASGTDPAVAKAAADRTITAYTTMPDDHPG